MATGSKRKASKNRQGSQGEQAGSQILLEAIELFSLADVFPIYGFVFLHFSWKLLLI